MSGSFTNDQTAVFSIEGSTFTSLLEVMKLLHKQGPITYNPGAGEFQGSNGEIIEVISVGKLKVSDKTGKSLFTIESDGTTTGLKFTEFSADGSFG